MENHQPKTSEIPMGLKDDSQSEVQSFQQERIESDELDYMLTLLLNAEIPPFIVTTDYKLRREQHTPQPQSDHECNNIQEKILGYNRKEKSLMELTRKFIQKFEGAPSNILMLDQVTIDLNVQRRRIYDIINIMESLCVVAKVKKNVYEWKGLKKAVETIQAYSQGDWNQETEKNRKQRSLESLSAQFLKLFSQRKSCLTLEEATQIILNDSNQHSRKTKIRRLYDIVNVFKCLGLVDKVKTAKSVGGKPLYQWLGCHSLLKIIEQKQKNFHISMTQQETPNSVSEEDSGSQKEHKIELQTKSSHIQNQITVHSLSCDSKVKNQCFKTQPKPLFDISNIQNVMNMSNTSKRNLIKREKALSKFNPKIFKSIQIIEPCSQIQPTRTFSFPSTEDYDYSASPSFFHNLYKHLSSQGNGSISQVHSRLTQIMWPKQRNQ